MEVSPTLIAVVFGALLLLLIALAIAYSDKIRYKLLPPRCEVCGSRVEVRLVYEDFDPRDPFSLGSKFLCRDCEAKEITAQIERLRIQEPETQKKNDQE